jgi:hypothetical protein
LEENLRDLHRDLTSGEIPGSAVLPNWPANERIDLIRKLEEHGCLLAKEFLAKQIVSKLR